MDQTYLLPPQLHDHRGQPRKAGFEFELGNLSVIRTAEVLQTTFGGELEKKSPFEAVLQDSAMGKLKIERDLSLLRSTKYRSWLQALGVEFTPGSIAHDIEINIDSASRQLIPCEVVTEPIAFSDLHKLDSLIDALAKLGAEGTQASLVYAFGLHINTSVPDLSSAVLKHYIQAFLLLQSWLIELSGTDVTRRFLTKFIDPFPASYMRQVLDNSYQPDLQKLISDYLDHNPTRNRALDMLPVFCVIERDLVLRRVNAEECNLIKPRPAFHYRLPDCRINVPGWSPALSWNQWIYVETLAANQALLQELIDAWRVIDQKVTLTPNSAWIAQLTTAITQKFFSGQRAR